MDGFQMTLSQWRLPVKRLSFLLMPRAYPFWIPVLSAIFLLPGLPRACADGFENFNTFPVIGSTYTDGTFAGQDGSIWTFVGCRGDKIITPLRTPGMDKGRAPAASVESGVITGGCGTLSLDWMRMFNTNCNFDILINGAVRHTVTGGVQNVTNHAGPFTINVGGNFTLKFAQNNSKAGQVAIDNIAWTSYGGGPPEPPELLFSPDTNGIATTHDKAIQFVVTATEPNEDSVHLWASGLPFGAAFNAAEGTSSVASTFTWTPSAAQTGTHSVVFLAGDKDGTNSRIFSIEVTPIYPYYQHAEGRVGAALKAKLHDIISAGAVQLTSSGSGNQLDMAMADIHTDPNNSSNVYTLYNTNSSVPKSLYNKDPGWNKEHCWPESRGLGNDGPDQVDVHNLFAEDKGVNALRGNLYFDESDAADPSYRSPATNAAPETSMDSNSFEPPDASKGNVARGIFYMATRYDGTEPKTSALYFRDTPSNSLPAMGKLSTLLLWHAMDPPDARESNRNETIYATYQHNRNPFIDHPEWAEQIWGVDPDHDGATSTHEIIAGTDPNSSNSVFTTSLSGTQIVCGSLSSGSVWRLYQGAFESNVLVWRQVAETNHLQSGTLRFTVAPTSPATFYHLRAIRP